jgi:hypothetical protein
MLWIPVSVNEAFLLIFSRKAPELDYVPLPYTSLPVPYLIFITSADAALSEMLRAVSKLTASQ